MAKYLIGDIHGCFDELQRLLDKIAFQPKKDKLYLCGDIVARGDKSLEALRRAKTLADDGVLFTVLGNHDVTLIATWLGVLPPKPKDKTLSILSAPDCDSLLTWLCHQPFLLPIDKKSVLVHAGIPPIWDTKEALSYADELHQAFKDKARLRQILPSFYSKAPKDWHTPSGRLGTICDYFTRMRLCSATGELDFNFKGDALDNQAMPAGFKPWFDWQNPITDKRKERIYFGHWAALEGKIANKKVRNLDGACVWGGKLLAYCLDDDTLTASPSLASKK